MIWEHGGIWKLRQLNYWNKIVNYELSICFSLKDEIVAAHSIGFAGQGTYVLAGFNKTIRIFHTSRPGRDFVQKSTTCKWKQNSYKNWVPVPILAWTHPSSGLQSSLRLNACNNPWSTKKFLAPWCVSYRPQKPSLLHFTLHRLH